jgi:hypothetical protein
MTQNNNKTISKKSKNTGKVVAEMTKNAVIHRYSSLFNPVKAGIKLPTAGIKKGQKQKKTLEREQIQEQAIQEAILEHKAQIKKLLPKIEIAQATLALGSVKLFAKVPFTDPDTGTQKTRIELIEDDNLIIDILSNTDLLENKDYFIMTKKDPNYQAQNAMLDRLLGSVTTKQETKNTFDGDLKININIIK